ncbi:thiamine diphosphokinase [Rhodobacterales bacterium 52_120_T64]|nr:thiamine diphosphokinase [Rhodobacterales bacterium 52_120_T64]
MTLILDSKTPITLVGGGPVDERLLALAVAHGTTVIAADGGVHRAQNLGVTVDHVIGDMDSVDLSKVDGPQMHPIAEQMSTDLDKCLRSCDAPYFIGVGFLGGRLDHQMAACHSLVEASDRQVVLIGEEDLCFLAPFSLSLILPVGTRVSLFPMGEVEGNSVGLKWPIHAYRFSPALMIGTSNETDSERLELKFDRRRMLVILPVEFIDDVISQVFVS